MSKRGSLWNKWDLHIHSPKTFLANNFQNCSTDDYVKAIVDSGVKAIGLTNYFRFHEEELGSIKQQLNNQGIVVFLNLEFRTQPPNKEKEEMHVHLIFSDTIEVSKIVGFLGRLETLDKKYCQNLTNQEISNTLISYTTLIKTLEADNEIRHFDDYLFIACPRGDGNYRPADDDDGRGATFAVEIDKDSDILFGNSKDTNFFLGTNRYEGAEAKPIVSCSDAHSLEGIGEKYTWIKANINFEGLKQILWEPGNRVKIQERNPNDTKTGRIIIDKVDFTNSNGKNSEILFNRDLNSIIGVRGSGKSTLLKNIAINIDRQQFTERGDNENRMYTLDSFTVTWGDGKKNGGDENSPKSIFYIPQNYLSMLSYDESGKKEERDEFLTSLLKKNAKFANALRAYANYVSDNKVKIEGLIEELLKADQLLKETQELIKKQGSKKEIKEEIAAKKEEIKKYKGKGRQALTEEEIKQYTDAKQTITDNTRIISILEQDNSILIGLQQSGVSVMSIASQELSRLSIVRQQSLKNELLKKSKENLIQLVTTEVKKITTEIKTLTQTIANKQKVLKKLNSKIKANKALTTLTKELSQLQQTLKIIDELGTTITQATTSKEVAITGIVESYSDYDAQQAAIFGSIEFDEDFQFLQINIDTHYNTSGLRQFVERNINTVTTSPKLNIEEDQDLKTMFGEAPVKPTTDTVRKFITKLIDGSIMLKVEAGETGQVISSFLRDRFEIDYLNSVRTREDDVLFKNMTGGQKAIAMLELVFSFDDERYPILIDQPEDDLDVSGVATDLVNFIKIHKENRQIIIVSHNGSLVVCSDTEEVIVSSCTKLEQGGYDFSYDTGAIEDGKMREQIIKVLEGGKEALKQRARKLNFKHEI